MFDTPTGEINFINMIFQKAHYGSWGMSVGTLDPDDYEVVEGMVKTFVSNYLELSKSVVYPIEESDDAVKRGYSYGDGMASKPADVVKTIQLKDGISHKEYKKRVAEGEIMMSNYKRYNIRVISSAGYRTLGTDINYLAYLDSQVFLDSGHLVPVVDYTGRTYYQIAGSRFLVDSVRSFAHYARVRTVGQWVFPPAPSPEDILSSIVGQIPDPKSVVTRTAAYANKRSLDVLTAAAEMPKTIASALRGIALVAKIIRDFKKGEFDLSVAHAHRKKVITKRYQARLDLLDNRILNPALSRKKRAVLQKQRDKLTLTMRETLTRSAQEFADALANLWLNYRYNLMPNIYLLQDIEKALARIEHEFITARSKQVDDGVMEGDGWRFTFPITLRCVIKRRFGDKSRFTAGGPQISADIFTTAWELVPLSFVVDWFVRIGDFLAAFSFKNDFDAEGSTLSELAKISTTIAFFPDGSWVIEPKVRIDAFYYNRLNINPTNYIGLCWQPNLDLARKTDALALIWRPVRSSLTNNKR